MTEESPASLISPAPVISSDAFEAPATLEAPATQEIPMTVEPSVTLEETLKKYDLSLSAKKVRLLEQYCEELWTWNEKINLTRHTDYDKFVSRDVIDAIHLSTLLQKGEHVLDVGTGGGVPGIILAILRPDITVELCDSTGKKARAVGEILDVLGLKLNVWYAKGEDLLKVHRFHTLIIRAVSRMDKLLEMFAPRWYAFDRLLMVKGPNWVEERGEARHLGRLNNLALRKLDEYQIPGTDHTSVILQVCRKERWAEMHNREEDCRQKKPIARLVESIAVDNTVPRAGTRKPAGRPRRDTDAAGGRSRVPKKTSSAEGPPSARSPSKGASGMKKRSATPSTRSRKQTAPKKPNASPKKD